MPVEPPTINCVVNFTVTLAVNLNFQQSVAAEIVILTPRPPEEPDDE